MARTDSERLLGDHLDGFTHANIRCRCHRVATVRSRALIDAVGPETTVRKAQTRLICTVCKCRGWATIEAAQR